MTNDSRYIMFSFTLCKKKKEEAFLPKYRLHAWCIRYPQYSLLCKSNAFLWQCIFLDCPNTDQSCWYLLVHVFLFCWLWPWSTDLPLRAAGDRAAVMPAFTPFAHELTLANVSLADWVTVSYETLNEPAWNTRAHKWFSLELLLHLYRVTVRMHHRGRLATYAIFGSTVVVEW